MVLLLSVSSVIPGFLLSSSLVVRGSFFRFWFDICFSSVGVLGGLWFLSFHGLGRVVALIL